MSNIVCHGAFCYDRVASAAASRIPMMRYIHYNPCLCMMEHSRKRSFLYLPHTYYLRLHYVFCCLLGSAHCVINAIMEFGYMRMRSL